MDRQAETRVCNVSTDKHTDVLIGWTYRQINGLVNGQTDILYSVWTDKQNDRWTFRLTDGLTDRRTGGWRERERERD